MLGYSRRLINSTFRTRTRFFAIQTSAVEEKIKNLGLELPEPPVSKGAFNQCIIVDDMAYFSGHLPQPANGKPLIVGKVGKDMTPEQGYEAAKIVGLNLISSMKNTLGSLDKVKKIVKLTGWVNSTDAFTNQPQVINGCSELFRKVFDEEQSGHARSAVGTNGLPLGVPVEIEAIVQIKKE